MVDFVGIGVQRGATSWLYSCIHEHPEICAPEKEINFFSRPRYEEKGIEWYKDIFASRCPKDTVKGEFSTSYLYHPKAAERIKEHFPNVKILVSLRNPIERAVSQYVLHTKAGWLDPKKISFDQFIDTEPTALEQGLYYNQLKRYYDRFPREHIHVIVKERIDTEPASVIRELFTFLGVDSTFPGTFIGQPINTDNIPRWIWVDIVIQHVSHFMYTHGMDRQVFWVKRLGILDLVRRMTSKGEMDVLSDATRKRLRAYFADDVAKTTELTGIPLAGYWGY